MVGGMEGRKGSIERWEGCSTVVVQCCTSNYFARIKINIEKVIIYQYYSVLAKRYPTGAFC